MKMKDIKKTKKAQTEIIGLIIIVIIIVIAGSFFLVNALRPSDSNRGNYEDPKLAQSFLNTIMNTKTVKNVIVSDIIKDCYDSKRRSLCDASGAIDCCDYARATLVNALDYSLGAWKKEYMLTVTKVGHPDLISPIYSSPKCHKDAPRGQPGFYYIPPSPPIVVTFIICDV